MSQTWARGWGLVAGAAARELGGHLSSQPLASPAHQGVNKGPWGTLGFPPPPQAPGGPKKGSPQGLESKTVTAKPSMVQVGKLSPQEMRGLGTTAAESLVRAMGGPGLEGVGLPGSASSLV